MSEKLEVHFKQPSVTIKYGRGYSTQPEQYTGEYTVTPSLSQQTLETSGKQMARNVVIEAMPQGSFGDCDWRIQYGTQAGQYVALVTMWTEIWPGGYIEDGSYDLITRTFHAIKTKTHITPTESEQTIGSSSRETILEGTVIIDPIPSDYAKITQNGTTLTTTIDGVEYTLVPT